MNSDTNSEIAALRSQIFTLLVALIVVSGTVTVYLYREASVARKEIEALRPQAQQVIGAFNQNQSLINNFFNQIVAYGQTHPEFRPILLKNGIQAQTPAAAAPKK